MCRGVYCYRCDLFGTNLRGGQCRTLYAAFYQRMLQKDREQMIYNVLWALPITNVKSKVSGDLEHLRCLCTFFTKGENSYVGSAIGIVLTSTAN